MDDLQSALSNTPFWEHYRRIRDTNVTSSNCRIGNIQIKLDKLRWRVSYGQIFVSVSTNHQLFTSRFQDIHSSFFTSHAPHGWCAWPPYLFFFCHYFIYIHINNNKNVCVCLELVSGECSFNKFIFVMAWGLNTK